MSTVTVRCAIRRFDGPPPVTALDGVDLDVPAGAITAVLGPSGCGKTTLLRAVAGLERLDGGSIAVGDRTVAGAGVHVAPERRSVGLVPQEGALFPHLDVAGNVGFGLRRTARDRRRRRVDELLELIGLPDAGRRRPHELSGGQQQRVAVARALAPDPAVVLLDEPFSALDTALRATLRDQVRTVLTRAGATAVLVTHDQEEAMSMADHLVVLRDGRVVQAGAPDAVYHRPADRWTASFLGDAVWLAGHRSGGSVRTVLGVLAVASHPEDPDDAGSSGPVSVLLRPEQVVPAPEGSTTGVDATVVDRRFRGADTTVGLRVGDDTVRSRWPSLGAPAPGETVTVGVHGPVRVYPSED